MADIVINGAEYKDVPSIEVPSSDGGVVEFEEKKPRTAKDIADEIEATFIANGWTKVEEVPADLNQNKAWAYGAEKKYVRVEVAPNNNTFEKVGNVIIENLFPSLTKIDNYRYLECPNLVCTELPSGVTSIGVYALSSCNNLSLTELPEGLTEVLNNGFSNCQNLALKSLPSSLTAIGNYAFYGCNNLMIDELPSSLTAIGSYAFASCSNLSISSIPDGITKLEDYLFYRCFNIYNLSLPSSLTAIGNGVFTEVPLSALAIRNSESVVTLASSAQFDKANKNGFHIYVPSALVESYKTATNWSVYASQFRALEDYTVDGTITGELDESKI